jgi:hypothetical protein
MVVTGIRSLNAYARGDEMKATLSGYRRQIALLILLMLTLACGGIGLAYEQDLSGPYAVWAPDSVEQAAIVEKIPDSSGATVVIDAMVFSYGWNDDFIIVKQHPNADGIDAVDAGVTQWFILDVANEKVYGPLTEEAYHRTRRDLGVPDSLDFTKTIDT